MSCAVTACGPCDEQPMTSAVTELELNWARKRSGTIRYDDNAFQKIWLIAFPATATSKEKHWL
jgi:hypothetical protein